MYALPAVCVCASLECTQECGSGMWALQSFACEPLVYTYGVYTREHVQ